MVTIAAPPLLMVSWSCKRCGHRGGTARTTFPIDPQWSEDMREVMLKTLRDKLVRTHQKQGCIAIPSDFVIGRYVP